MNQRELTIEGASAADGTLELAGARESDRVWG